MQTLKSWDVLSETYERQSSVFPRLIGWKMFEKTIYMGRSELHSVDYAGCAAGGCRLDQQASSAW